MSRLKAPPAPPRWIVCTRCAHAWPLGQHSTFPAVCFGCGADTSWLVGHTEFSRRERTIFRLQRDPEVLRRRINRINRINRIRGARGAAPGSVLPASATPTHVGPFPR